MCKVNIAVNVFLTLWTVGLVVYAYYWRARAHDAIAGKFASDKRCAELSDKLATARFNEVLSQRSARRGK